MSKKFTIIKIGRDAGSGQFTTTEYADKHKKTTITETIKIPLKKK